MRALLPPWVLHGPLLYWPVGAFLLSLTATWVVLRLALRPLRREPDAHWTERARLAFPVRSLAMVCLLLTVVPVFAIGAGLDRVGRLTLVLTALAGWLGVLVNEVRAASVIRRSPVTLRMGMRGWAILLLLLYPHLLIFFALLAAMPGEMGPRAWAVLAAGTLAMLLLIRFSGIPLLRALKLARPASPRLQAIVEQTARRVGIRPAAVWELSWPATNAAAFPWPNCLAFSEALVEDFSDEEIGAIAVHELSHLTEPRSVQISRTFGAWLLLPLAAVSPILGSYGLLAFLGVYTLTLLALLAIRRLARRMEVRADALSREHQEEEGIYARALEHVYRANQMPAVLRGKRKVHPDLYDRLLAVGVQPDYPRPAPPRRPFVLTAAAMILFAMGWLGLGYGLPRAVAPLLSQERQILLRAALWGASEVDVVGELAFARLEEGKTREALELFRTALARHPDDIHLLISLAQVLDSEERCEEARQVFAGFEVQLAAKPSEERELWAESLPYLLQTCRAEAPRAR